MPFGVIRSGYPRTWKFSTAHLASTSVDRRCLDPVVAVMGDATGQLTTETFLPKLLCFSSKNWRQTMMKLSARNQIKGKVTEVIKGQTTGHVHIDIGNGVIVHAAITNEAIDDLALKVASERRASHL